MNISRTAIFSPLGFKIPLHHLSDSLSQCPMVLCVHVELVNAAGTGQGRGIQEKTALSFCQLLIEGRKGH